MRNDIVMGPKEEKFVMGNPIKTEKWERSVNDFLGVFTIKCGPLVLEGYKHKKVFLLEIEYQDAEKTQRELLGGAAFGNTLNRDYAQEANKLAQEYCEKKGFALDQIMASWPEFQALLSKP